MKIYRIVKILHKNLSFDEIKQEHRFLHENLLEQIKVYQVNNGKIYSFFNEIAFVLTCANSKEELDCLKIKNIQMDKNYNDNIVYHAFFNEKTSLNQEEISQLLRNSKTLIINENNYYKNENDIEVVFDKEAFYFETKSAQNKTSFDRILFEFLLMLSYNFKIQNEIKKAANVCECEPEKMVKLRDELLIFSLKYFFKNPILTSREQSYRIWEILSKKYCIFTRYEEIERQIITITQIIDAKNKEEKAIKEAKLEEIRSQKEKKFNKKMSIFAFIISVFSLISIYKDMHDLGWIKALLDLL